MWGQMKLVGVDFLSITWVQISHFTALHLIKKICIFFCCYFGDKWIHIRYIAKETDKNGEKGEKKMKKRWKKGAEKSRDMKK